MKYFFNKIADKQYTFAKIRPRLQLPIYDLRKLLVLGFYLMSKKLSGKLGLENKIKKISVLIRNVTIMFAK